MNDFPIQGTDTADQRTECVVMKFGGTSVEDAPSIQRVADLVKQRLRLRPVVVLSALAKVTDQLLSAGKAAAEGRRDAARETVQLLRDRHEQIAVTLVKGEGYERLRCDLENEFQLLDGVLLGIAGTALAIGEWRGVIVLVVMTANYWIKAGREDTILASKFGGAFEEHRKRAGFLLPRL